MSIDLTAPTNASLKHRKAVQVSRRLFQTGCFGFVFIGVLHTAVHLLQLSGARVKGELADRELVEGYTAYDIWMGTSLLMGLFSVGIGLLGWAALRSMPGRPAPKLLCATNMVILCGVWLMGLLYMGPLQLFGSMGGIAVFGAALAVGRKS